jgi:hypothetical protein
MCPVRFAIPPMKKKTFLGRLIDISYRQHTAKAEKMVRTSSIIIVAIFKKTCIFLSEIKKEG